MQILRSRALDTFHHSRIRCRHDEPHKLIAELIVSLLQILSMVTAFVQDRAQAAAVRFLLGIFEAGE